LRSKRLQWLNNLSDKLQAPCDLGLSKIQARCKNCHESVGALKRTTSRTITTGISSNCLRPRNPSPCDLHPPETELPFPQEAEPCLIHKTVEVFRGSVQAATLSFIRPAMTA
jgi:hypothetical protein